MKEKKNRLDEMQEQKMLRIEHNACWLAFWGLFLVIFGQWIFYGPERMELVTGEWIVFLILALYIAAACIKNGIWDRKLKPSWKVNLFGSAIAGVAGGVIRFLTAYFRYGDKEGALAGGGIVCGNIFVICFLCLSLGLFIYRKRVERFEEEEPDEQEKFPKQNRNGRKQ